MVAQPILMDDRRMTGDLAPPALNATKAAGSLATTDHKRLRPASP